MTLADRVLKSAEEVLGRYIENLAKNDNEDLRLYLEGYVCAQELAIEQIKHDIFMDGVSQ